MGDNTIPDLPASIEPSASKSKNQVSPNLTQKRPSEVRPDAPEYFTKIKFDRNGKPRGQNIIVDVLSMLV